MPTILYVSNLASTFVELDRKVLAERYNVHSLIVQKRSPALFAQMYRKTQGVDLVVAWFASWHSLPAFVAARLRGIPRLLISGGYDVANVPEIGYGLQQGGIPKLISGQVFRLASHTILNSQTAYSEALRNTPLDPRCASAVPHGVPDNPIFTQATPKESIAFTVATLDTLSIERKGVRLFVEAARHLPDTLFYVVGKARDNAANILQITAPPNVKFTGFMSDDELTELRRRAKVYVQASWHEGFGMALAESMLARCIPVVSPYGALPEVAGEIGVVTNAMTPEAVATSIRTALAVSPDHGERARQHILSHFPLSSRADGLYKIVDTLLNSSNLSLRKQNSK